MNWTFAPLSIIKFLFLETKIKFLFLDKKKQQREMNTFNSDKRKDCSARWKTSYANFCETDKRNNERNENWAFISCPKYIKLFCEKRNEWISISA